VAYSLDVGRGEHVSFGGQPDRWSGLGKFAAGSAVLMLLSLGLCGVALSQNHMSGGMAMAGLLGFLAGGLGLAVAALIAIVIAISGSGSKAPPPDPPYAGKDDNLD